MTLFYHHYCNLTWLLKNAPLSSLIYLWHVGIFHSFFYVYQRVSHHESTMINIINLPLINNDLYSPLIIAHSSPQASSQSPNPPSHRCRLVPPLGLQLKRLLGPFAVTTADDHSGLGTQRPCDRWSTLWGIIGGIENSWMVYFMENPNLKWSRMHDTVAGGYPYFRKSPMW